MTQYHLTIILYSKSVLFLKLKILYDLTNVSEIEVNKNWKNKDCVTGEMVQWLKGQQYVLEGSACFVPSRLAPK